MTGAAVGIVLSFILATALAAFFHLCFGGTSGRIVLYIFLSFIGFAIGHFFGQWLQIDTMKLGAVYFLPAAFGSMAMLFFGRWLWGNDMVQRE